MNKITPHLLRDLHATLPEGTEKYLCKHIREALTSYRLGYESEVVLDKSQALSVLSRRLGRGLKRFLQEDMRIALTALQGGNTNRMA